MMTETEAKTKWCPFARLVLANDASKVELNQTAFNRVCKNDGTPLSAPVQCIASACMAWRWIESEHEYAVTDSEQIESPDRPGWIIGNHLVRPSGEGWEPVEQYPTFGNEKDRQFKDCDGWRRVAWQRPINKRGHCGLAGSP